MKIEDLRKDSELLDLFCELVTTPSPSFKEQAVSTKILKFFKENGVEAKLDEYGNVKAYIPATDKNKKPILLSAHMDVIGDDSPVNLCLNENIIETDKTRTLGADDKVGVCSAMMLAKEVAKSNLKHGGLEIVFTRDEERTMSGIENLKMEELKSEYALVLDADMLGHVQISGASFTKLVVKVKALIGGHSGNDIGDKKRLNAVKLIAELVNEIPQGVYKEDELGVVTSLNAGAIIGGGIGAPISAIVENQETNANKYQNYILDNAVTNVINTDAGVIYSVRSTDKNAEESLIKDVQKIIDNFNKKYKNLAKAEVIKEVHLLPFEKSDDDTIPEAAKIVSKNINLPIKISSFHAGAETHIYANKCNSNGQKFKPCLIGLANIYNMHSSDEQVDYKTLLKGYDFLKELFKVFNRG